MVQGRRKHERLKRETVRWPLVRIQSSGTSKYYVCVCVCIYPYALLMREQFGNGEAEGVNMAVHVCLSERFLSELCTKELKCSGAESHTFGSTMRVCVQTLIDELLYPCKHPNRFYRRPFL